MAAGKLPNLSHLRQRLIEKVLARALGELHLGRGRSK